MALQLPSRVTRVLLKDLPAVFEPVCERVGRAATCLLPPDCRKQCTVLVTEDSLSIPGYTK